MCIRVWRSFLLVVLWLPLLSWADVVFDFSRGSCGVELSGETVFKDGLLVFNGDGKAILPDSAQYSITDQGLTVSMVVCFRPHGNSPGQDLIMKAGEWRMCRDNNYGRLHVSLTDGEKYYGAARGGTPVSPGIWAHYTAVYERIMQKGEGRFGYCQKAYINGVLVGIQEHLNVESPPTDNPVVVGYGPGHHVMAFLGEIASIKIWQRALTDDEIDQDLLSDKRVKIPRPASQAVSDGFQRAIAPLPDFDREALHRAAQNGADQDCLIQAVSKMAKGEPQDAVNVVATDRMKVLLLARGARKVFPVIGIYDLHAKREILGGQGMDWQLELERGGQSASLQSGEFAAQVTMRSDRQAELLWDCGTVRVEMRLCFDGGRVEADYSATSLDAETTLVAASFPRWRLAKMTCGVDRLVMPFMSGVELANPTTKHSTVAPQDYVYPTAALTMQFGAYYDEAGGVYFAHEDPTGSVKRIASAGRRGNLEITYTTAIARACGSQYRLQGCAALELFTGNWYEAARIYRRFVDSKAEWRIEELPRRDTPERLRNNTVCFHGRTRYGYTGQELVRDMVAVRRYLELPFIVHWNDWYDLNRGDWPHFHLREDCRDVVGQLKQADIDCEVYIDTRLWAEKDGPTRGSNLLFDPVGKRCAVRSADGGDHRESYMRWFHEPGSGKGKNQDGWYSERYEYVIMCPAAQEWQLFIQNICAEIAADGINGVYHDQVMAARPIPCFSSQHGHPIGDVGCWVSAYWKMFDPIRGELKKRYPGLWHSSEDVAEPYLRQFDSAFCWRWTHEQIPLFSTVYAGKIQLGYRLYGDIPPDGDIKAFHAKLAEQLVRGEQLGYFYKKELASPQAMLGIKRMAHLRLGLVSFFNGGELLKNLPYRTPMPMIGTLWMGYKGGFGGGDAIIHTPAVQQGHWRRLADQAELVALVNSTADNQSCSVLYTGDAAQLVTAEGSVPYHGEEIALAPFESALILTGTQPTETRELASLLKRIRAFTEPENLTGK